MGVILGAVAAIVFMSVALFLVMRRLQMRHGLETQRYDESIVDLRQERAEDKETNRRLRHELVSLSPDRLIETASTAEFERDHAISERDQALEQLHLVQQDMTSATRRLADREAKLRQYREALKEIRMSLEAQDRGRGDLAAAGGLIDTDTDEVPAEAFPLDPNPNLGTGPVQQSEPETADLSTAAD